MIRALVSLAAALALVAVGHAARAQSPTTVTPDRATVLVSKDINGERWAIARDLSNGSVTGNVFVPGSPDPLFVYCTQTGQGAGGIVFNCFGTGRCGVPDCATNWLLLGPVTLPASFFAAGGAGPGPTPTPAPSGLAGLLGTWRFQFTIISTFVREQRFRQLVTREGIQAILGMDEFGADTVTARIQDLTPGSPLPYEYATSVFGSLLCEIYVYDQTGPDTIAGIHSQAIVSRGDCGSFLGQHPTTGRRLSRTASGDEPASALRESGDLQARAALAESYSVDVPSPLDGLSAVMGALRQ